MHRLKAVQEKLRDALPSLAAPNLTWRDAGYESCNHYILCAV